MQKNKQSLKTVPLSLRTKKRYIAFSLFSEGKSLNQQDVWHALQQTLLQLYGEHGVALMELKFISFDARKQQGIFKVALSELSKAKAGLLFLTHVAKIAAQPQILKVSGSVKGAK